MQYALRSMVSGEGWVSGGSAGAGVSLRAWKLGWRLLVGWVDGLGYLEVLMEGFSKYPQ